MKYSPTNKPLYCGMTQSTWYRNTGVMRPVGVLWHSTGANNPTVKRYVQPSDNAPDRARWLDVIGVNTLRNDWNHVTVQSGVNAFVGLLADGTVSTVQVGDWSKRPWGCGSGRRGSCNDGWIQFEICEDGLNDPAYFLQVYREAVELTAYLCKLYKLDPLGKAWLNGVSVPVILCHNDAYMLGLGTGHADVNHWLPKFGKSMQTAREDVAALLEDDAMTGEEIYARLTEYLSGQTAPDWAEAELAEAQKAGLFDGSNPMQLIPRYQAAIMTLRAIKEANK